MCVSDKITFFVILIFSSYFSYAKMPSEFEGIKLGSTYEETSKTFPLVNGEDKYLYPDDQPESCKDEPDNRSSAGQRTGYMDESTGEIGCSISAAFDGFKKYSDVVFNFRQLDEKTRLEQFRIILGPDQSLKVFIDKVTKIFGKPTKGKGIKLPLIWEDKSVKVELANWEDKIALEMTSLDLKNEFKKKLDESNKLEHEDELKCPAGTVKHSAPDKLPGPPTKDAEADGETISGGDNSIMVWAIYCIRPAGINYVGVYTKKVEADSKGYLHQVNKQTDSIQTLDVSKVNGPMWFWDQESRKLIQKWEVKNGKAIKIEKVGEPSTGE